MKRLLFLVLLLLFTAAPALATGGFECRTTDGSNIVISGAVGHMMTAPLINAHLTLGDRILSTATVAGEEPSIAIGRSWLDTQEIRIDLVDPQVTRFEARLRARFRGADATGTLVRDEVSHPVRCTIE